MNLFIPFRPRGQKKSRVLQDKNPPAACVTLFANNRGHNRNCVLTVLSTLGIVAHLHLSWNSQRALSLNDSPLPPLLHILQLIWFWK